MEAKYIILILKILMCAAIFMFFRETIRYLRKSRIVEKAIRGFILSGKNKEDGRFIEEQKLRFEEGKQEKTGFLCKLDHLVLQSNLKHYVSFLNTELYLFFALGSASIGFFITNALVHTWIAGIMAFVCILFIFYLVLYVLSGINYKKTEENIITFVNLMENYSKTSDDLLNILGKVSRYLGDPLKSAVEECYMEGRTTGNVSEAFYNLQLRIEHEKFKGIIRNLEICSRHEANYAEIIRDSRDILREYLAAKKERKSMINNARVEVSILIACSVFVLYMMDGFMQKSIISILMSSLIGQGLLLYSGIVMLFTIFNVMKFVDTPHS